MKRYFIVPPGALPHELPAAPHVGEYHYIDLDSHGPAGVGYRVLVLIDQSKVPPESWLELPHLLDAQMTLAALPAMPDPIVNGVTVVRGKPLTPTDVLADVGAKATHKGYSLAKVLAVIHPAFEP